MSVFDLFRGFFGVPGGHFRGRRDPFFDAMTHDDDDDDDEEDGFSSDGFRRDQQDPFGDAWRFGFSFGPDGMRFQEPAMFGHVLREMEEIFSQLGRWEGHPESGHFGVPRILPPSPPEDGSERNGGSRNPLRDFMLKSPNGDIPRSHQEDQSEAPDFPCTPFNGWSPFSKFNDFWGQGPQRTPGQEPKEDRDLDSAVSSGGLDQILTPSVGQGLSEPRSRSFFQSVIVTKVVKPDGTVEERRTVRDGHGNEKTTVTRSGSPGRLDGPDQQSGPVLPGDSNRFSDLRDDDSLFSRIFGGFK
ncbi:HCLS1-associated protein X-1 [Girardinichthys multiradiatus]|uniref:HCLS1-associated protein X-1 n=1 Tax=Girardinichthys multiradiatus TaxID=208333 RepID=UPI001FAB45A2|nr:HCLS1-associated protein X-1 [Girardinichthys multiradiatus]